MCLCFGSLMLMLMMASSIFGLVPFSLVCADRWLTWNHKKYPLTRIIHPPVTHFALEFHFKLIQFGVKLHECLRLFQFKLIIFLFSKTLFNGLSEWSFSFVKFKIETYANNDKKVNAFFKRNSFLSNFDLNCKSENALNEYSKNNWCRITNLETRFDWILNRFWFRLVIAYVKVFYKNIILKLILGISFIFNSWIDYFG